MTGGRFETWPITIRVAIATGVLMILLGLIASQQVLSTLSRLQNDRLREVAQLHLDGLAVALGPFVLHRDVWEVYDTLDRARRNSAGARIVFTAVADDQGHVLASTDPGRAPIDAMIETLSDGAVSVGRLTAGDGEDVVRITEPLFVQGREVGRVLTELDVSDLVAQRRATSIALLAGNALVTIILVVAGYLVVARLLKPVELLTEYMGAASGSPQPVPESAIPKAGSVFARLLRNFNEMADAIDARAEAERRLADRERFVSLGRLSSSLAHEINNPLGGLLNAADTLRTYSDRPEVVRQSAELLERGLKHMRDVSRAILEENRLDRSQRPLSVADFDDLRLLFEPETVRRTQTLEWRVQAQDGPLQPFPSAPIRQIALNLLLNASAAAPVGGTVSFVVSADEGGVNIDVEDNGRGLTSVESDRLFSGGPIAAGGGVGLRLVRELVGSLQGAIEHHRDDARTRITVRIPINELSQC